VNDSKIRFTQLRRRRNELKAKLEDKEVAHKDQMHVLQKDLYKAEAIRKKAEGMSSDFGKTSKKMEKERNFYKSKLESERETAEVPFQRDFNAILTEIPNDFRRCLRSRRNGSSTSRSTRWI